MRIAAFVGGACGIALLVLLIGNTDVAVISEALQTAGWPIIWLLPYRAAFFLLYALGWLVLLRPYNLGPKARFSYLFWVTLVRDAVDRLLPVASVGGSVVGIRLVRWRGLAPAGIGASVIVEIVLTLIACYLVTALGLGLLVQFVTSRHYHQILMVFLMTLPIPIILLLLLRYGSVFARLHRLLRRLLGASLRQDAESPDIELRASVRRGDLLSIAVALQCVALLSGSFEIWFALWLFGHPVSVRAAIVLESLTQAVRHVAFMVPAGIGAQEGGLILFGQALGISNELALSVAMIKRAREVAWAIPALLSWQWAENRRRHNP